MSEANGLTLVDKPGGMSSHDVVGRLRRLARTRKVGHAGTLDPMATGVLVCGVGPATRLLHHLVLTGKSYTATVRLGAATVTDDAEGEVVSTAPAGHLTEAQVRAAMTGFVGDIEQVPSAVSAIKVDGQRAHRLVRAGEQVDLPARPVNVARFEAVALRRDATFLDVDVVVECSSGTYVRALARDLGAVLGTGGHLTALRRTRVGTFDVADAVALDELAEPVTLPLEQAVRHLMPVREITAEQADQLSYGRFLDPVGIEGLYAVLLADGTVIGLLREYDSGTVRGGGHFARPELIWHARG